MTPAFILLPYASSKNRTAKDERAVKSPSPRIPILKLKWSAITPRTKGVLPIPRITPMERITPVAIDRSEREVNFDMATRPTGKNAEEKVACRKRVIRIEGRVEAAERLMVLRPVAKRLTLSILPYP